MKRWWFNSKARELVKEKYPEVTRKVTTIENFHAKSLQEHKRGTFALKDLSNMDQTPLPYVMDDNRTYE